MPKFKSWSLQLFNDGAQAQGTGESTNDTVDAARTQDAPAGAQEENKTVSPDEEFEALISGQYKEQFQKRTQGIIDKRFKNHKELEKQVEQNKAINEAIAVKYGIDPSDTQALMKAVTEDSSLIEDAAYNEGLTVEQYRSMLEGRKAQRELNAIREKEQQAEQEERRRQLAQAIDEQTASIRSKYADESFDFWNEYNNNPEFKGMIDARVPIETAYKVINQDRVISAAEKRASAAAKKSVTDDIIANGRRPMEGGMQTSPTANAKKSAKDLTDAEMEALEERARRGEIIRSF